MAKNSKKWTMPEWMVKYSRTIGGEKHGTREAIEKIYNSQNLFSFLTKRTIAAKIEVLQSLESRRLI